MTILPSQGLFLSTNPVPIHPGHGDTGPSDKPVCVEYKISLHPDMKDAESRGQLFTSSDVDYTIKVCIEWSQEPFPFSLAA